MMPVLAALNPIEHVVPHRVVGPLDNHMLMEIVAAALLVLLLTTTVGRRRLAGAEGGDIEAFVPRGLTNFFETICQFLRDHVARPALGPYADRFLPYVWTVFFFILFCNLLGLLPIDSVLALVGIEAHIGGTATGNVWVTGTLALCTLTLILFNGLRLHGMAYVAHFFQGPLYVAWLIGILEIVGLIAKTFALAVRLFANMIAGHILLAVLASFVPMTYQAVGALGGVGVAVPVVLGSVAISVLEILVAFIQAFIFAFLSALFIGQAVLIHHGEEHSGEGEGEELSHAGA